MANESTNASNALDQNGLGTLWERISSLFLRKTDANTTIDNRLNNAGLLTSEPVKDIANINPSDFDCSISGISISGTDFKVQNSNNS